MLHATSRSLEHRRRRREKAPPAAERYSESMKSLAGALLGILCLHAAASAQTPVLGRSALTWSLVWSDEFDSAGIDASNWTYDIGGNGWGNSELEYYTDRSENATIRNGELLIIARSESYGGNSYTSARLKTQNLRTFTYGRVEARIKLPAAQGLWPAFWLLGNDIARVGWPMCGEIDVMEHINRVPFFNGGSHWGNNGRQISQGTTESCDVTQYHIYSIEWDAGTIVWLIDGVQYLTESIADTSNGIGEFHLPFFIILNMAVGGGWPGSPDSTTPFPDTMFVDYVRVYKVATGVATVGPGPVPDRFLLQQNYPDPFNPSTTIRYALPARMHVTLTVYNTLGGHVATLVNGSQEAGYHDVRFDGRNLASGVYFYRLMAGDFVETKRLLLVR